MICQSDLKCSCNQHVISRLKETYLDNVA
jgi:hypothetical protein